MAPNGHKYTLKYVDETWVKLLFEKSSVILLIYLAWHVQVDLINLVLQAGSNTLGGFGANSQVGLFSVILSVERLINMYFLGSNTEK